MSRTATILSCLLLVSTLQANDEAARLAAAWSQGSLGEAEQAARQAPAELRLEATRALLQSEQSAARKRGVRLAERLWLHALLPELRELPGNDALCAKLAQYQRFAIEREPEVLARTPAEAAAGWFVSHQLHIEALDSRGQPLAQGRLLAYSHDYDISVPVAEPAQLDANGRGQIRLPEGSYTLLVASDARTRPVLLRSARLELVADQSLRLQAERQLPIEVLDAQKPRELRLELAARSHPFLSFEFRGRDDHVELSEGLQLRGQLRGADAQGEFFLLANDDDARLRFELEPAAHILWQGPEQAPATVRLDLRLGDEGVSAVQVELPRGQGVRVSPGACDVGYSYEHAALERLSFQRKAYSLERGGQLELTVGAPLQARVWATLYNKRYQKLAPFAVRAFLLDGQGHVLSTVQQRDRGRGRRLLRVEVLRAGELIHTTRRSYADLDAALAGPALDELRYRLLCPLPLQADEVAGEGALERRSERYSISAPAFLEAEAQTFLAAAERIYEPLREVALRKLKWTRGSIRIHPSMPAGVRAYASSTGTSNFNVFDLLHCTRLRDALGSTPIFHEHLHTVGYSHSDYMDVAGLRIRRGLDPDGARWMGRGKKPAQALQFLLEGTDGKGGILARLLLQREGGALFDGYLARRKERTQLQALGLSEKEADCALFSDVCGHDLSALFATVHAGIDAEDVEAGLAEVDTPAAAPSSSGGFGFADLKRALADADQDPAPLVLAWQAKISEAPALRAQTRHFLRLGELLFLSGREDDACSCFRAALEAAVDVDAGFFGRTRKEALGVLGGEPLGLGWM